MGEFNLIKVDGKPIEKLIDVVSKAVGKIYKPRAIREEADAKAYEISVIEKAKAEAFISKQELKQDMLDMISERLIHREIKKQINIDNITQNAAIELKDESNVSDSPVDEDWAVRFFNIAEDVSDEQMQQLWGKILAGEIKTPNTYSIRTLECLKNMTKNDAELFTKIANFVFIENETPFIFKANNDEVLERNNFSFSDRLKLIEIGLIQPEMNIVRKYSTNTEEIISYYQYGKYFIRAVKKANSPLYNIPALCLTTIGVELYKLLTMNVIDDYFKEYILFLQNIGFEVDYAFILKKNNNSVEHTQPWMKLVV